MDNLLAYAITAVLGGGLFKGLEALVRAITDSKEKRTLANDLGAKTPAEVESVSVDTMTRALASAQTRITSLENERALDQKYYQDRIKELNDQLQKVRDEMASMEQKLSDLLVETHHTPDSRDTK